MGAGMRRSTYGVLLAALVVWAPAVYAQAAKRKISAPVVKRAQDPEVLQAAADNLAGAITYEWAGNNQSVVQARGCVMTIKSTRSRLSTLTVDEQTFDAADLFGESEMQDAGDAYDLRLYSTPRLRAFVTRNRRIYLDGAEGAPRSDKVVFLTLAIPKANSERTIKVVAEAVKSYRMYCQRT